jgi:hypothetical protein
LDQAKSEVAETLDALYEQKHTMTVSKAFASAAEQAGYDQRLREIAMEQAEAEARWEALAPWSEAAYALQYPDMTP